MKNNIIIVCKYKLGSIDEMMPILMEIQKRDPSARFVFLFPNEATHKLNMQNYGLWKAIQSLNPKIMITRGRNDFVTVVWFLKFLFFTVFHKNIILKMMDVIPKHKWVIRILKILSKTIEVRCYLRPWTPEMAKNLHWEETVIRKRRKRPLKKEELKGEYDFFISTITKDQFKTLFDLELLPEKIVKMGYPRRLPGWTEFLKKSSEENGIMHKGRYCLYIVGPLEKRIEVLDEPMGADLFEETLSVLKKFENEIKVIFKPHAATDLNKLEASIQKAGLKNYKIDFGHAMILANGAEFIVSYYFSETMVDACYLGKPIIEYNALDPELLAFYKGRSIAGELCDFFIKRDKQELERVVEGIINGKIKVHRDSLFLAEFFREIHPDFYLFLGNLLGKPFRNFNVGLKIF